jgi:hypothetical protein
MQRLFYYFADDSSLTIEVLTYIVTIQVIFTLGLALCVVFICKRGRVVSCCTCWYMVNTVYIIYNYKYLIESDGHESLMLSTLIITTIRSAF